MSSTPSPRLILTTTARSTRFLHESRIEEVQAIGDVIAVARRGRLRDTQRSCCRT